MCDCVWLRICGGGSVYVCVCLCFCVRECVCLECEAIGLIDRRK